jgi:hypothetical protein
MGCLLEGRNALEVDPMVEEVVSAREGQRMCRRRTRYPLVRYPNSTVFIDSPQVRWCHSPCPAREPTGQPLSVSLKIRDRGPSLSKRPSASCPLTVPLTSAPTKAARRSTSAVCTNRSPRLSARLLIRKYIARSLCKVQPSQGSSIAGKPLPYQRRRYRSIIRCL